MDDLVGVFREVQRRIPVPHEEGGDLTHCPYSHVGREEAPAPPSVDKLHGDAFIVSSFSDRWLPHTSCQLRSAPHETCGGDAAHGRAQKSELGLWLLECGERQEGHRQDRIQQVVCRECYTHREAYMHIVLSRLQGDVLSQVHTCGHVWCLRLPQAELEVSKQQAEPGLWDLLNVHGCLVTAEFVDFLQLRRSGRWIPAELWQDRKVCRVQTMEQQRCCTREGGDILHRPVGEDACANGTPHAVAAAGGALARMPAA